MASPDILDRFTFDKLTHDQQRALVISVVKDAILLIAHNGTSGAELVEALTPAHVPVEIITMCVGELVKAGNLATTDNYHFRTVRGQVVD